LRVAIYGAGALGAVHGVLLAHADSVDVSFVVRAKHLGLRPNHPQTTAPIVIERVHGGRRSSIEEPDRVTAVPEDADAILVAVGTENLPAIEDALLASSAPIVVLTPMLPPSWTSMKARFGARIFSAMPRVVAYTRQEDQVVRYWLAPSSTLIDEPRASEECAGTVRELAAALRRAGLRGRLALGVHEKNPATTVRFIAMGMALAIAGSTKALASDERLLVLTSRACREGSDLASRIGEPEAWTVFAPVLAAPWAFPLWLDLLGRASPEGLFYAEEHFGRKLRAQHRVMIHDMIDLARDKGLPHAAFDEMAARLDALA
jgi:2-dehydropantoate 2-reductase